MSGHMPWMAILFLTIAAWTSQEDVAAVDVKYCQKYADAFICWCFFSYSF